MDKTEFKVTESKEQESPKEVKEQIETIEHTENIEHEMVQEKTEITEVQNIEIDFFELFIIHLVNPFCKNFCHNLHIFEVFSLKV